MNSGTDMRENPSKSDTHSRSVSSARKDWGPAMSVEPGAP